MKNSTTIIVLLVLISAVILFHLCIVAKIIPYHIAWGGRLQNDTEMYVFEFLSIIINLFLAFVLLMKAAVVKPYFKKNTLNFILWFFLFLFVLNTLGNLFAKSNFEKLFSILTFIFAILIWSILKKERKKL